MYLRTFLIVASIFAFVSQSLASLGTNMGVSSSGNSQTCSPAEACSTDKTTKLLSVKDLLVQPPDIIVSLLGGIYEHSPWVAENFVQQQKRSKEEITTVTELATHLQTIVDGSSREVKLTLLQSHPDLCEKVEKMKELTVESQQEQSRAGLQSMERDELQKFKDRNTYYKTKFGFPFILAVRNASKHTVLSALEGRSSHSMEQEFVTAMEQVHKIAWMRLLANLNTDDAQGFLTCHGECKQYILWGRGRNIYLPIIVLVLYPMDPISQKISTFWLCSFGHCQWHSSGQDENCTNTIDTGREGRSYWRIHYQ
jgi:2-oxo-4-hydroxy-4-carboxy-5-ureidoimidazoline decarboxylase